MRYKTEIFIKYANTKSGKDEHVKRDIHVSHGLLTNEDTSYNIKSVISLERNA